MHARHLRCKRKNAHDAKKYACPAFVAVHYGDMLRRYRKSQGWTLAEAASVFGLSISYLHELETGKKDMTLRAAKMIAKRSPLTVSQLLGIKERA